ncbi:MAG: hypothetical protein V5A72_02340 [Candidatus Nanohaloarchaea archaeon]
MEAQDILIAVASFFLAAGTGFTGHQMMKDADNFSEDTSLKVDVDNQNAGKVFDGNYLGLKYEDDDRGRFYFKFNDSRGIQRIQDLRQDGTLQRTKKIRSFGNKTYFLHLRYQDDPEVMKDGFMELYMIEES